MNVGSIIALLQKKSLQIDHNFTTDRGRQSCIGFEYIPGHYKSVEYVPEMKTSSYKILNPKYELNWAKIGG